MLATEIQTCIVCDQRRRPNSSSLVWRPFRDQWQVFVCHFCIDSADHPGKFEGLRHNRVELGKALALSAMDLEGLADDYLPAEGSDYVSRLGRFLFFESSAGFVSFEEFETEDAARVKFDSIETKRNETNF